MTLPLPDHWSYSSLISTYKSCPRQFYLSRIKQAQPLPAWYFVVGSTVHEVIEYKLGPDDYRGDIVGDYFTAEVLKARQDEPDTSKWLHSTIDGEPVIEERALKLARDCVEAALDWLEDFDVWEVEPDISGFLPGCKQKIKAFPDLIGHHKKHGDLIIDWKTGKTRGQPMQLMTYNALMREQPDLPWMEHGGTSFRGMFVMLNPAAGKTRPIKLEMTPAEVGAMYGELEKKVNGGAFPALPNFMCEYCSMRPNCKTKSGANKRTLYYDTPEKDGVIPY